MYVWRCCCCPIRMLNAIRPHPDHTRQRPTQYSVLSAQLLLTTKTERHSLVPTSPSTLSSSCGLGIYLPIYPSSRRHAGPMHPKGKGRSHSNPFPLSTAFEPIPPIMTPDLAATQTLRLNFTTRVPPPYSHVPHGFTRGKHARRERDGEWTVIEEQVCWARTGYTLAC